MTATTVRVAKAFGFAIRTNEQKAHDEFIGWAQNRITFGHANGGAHVARCLTRRA